MDGYFLVMALDLDDSVKVFGTYASEESARAAMDGLEKANWRFTDWRVEAWTTAEASPAVNGRS